jgi:hypothetical protein|tara:strand:- start:611 stop:1255 length:645 start_codon:yes stop_codon:yes gene_type:complete
MSTKISKQRFKEILKNLIRKEIEEASTTVTAGGGEGQGIHYDTPKAFSTGSGHPTDGEVGGYEKVNEAKWAVTIDLGIKVGDGKVIVDAGSKGAAITMVAKRLKQGRNGIKSVSRVQPAFGKQVDKKIENVTEGKSKYHTWKEDKTLTPKQKIGRAIREVRSSLSDLSKTIDRSVKLKTEMEVNSSDYWKTTHKALSKISERLVKMANKVGKLQ